MKNYAIEVFFNSDFDEYVREFWNSCDYNNLSSFMNRVKGTEPHIALAVYENIDFVQLENRFQKFIEKELYSFELIFDAVAFFTTSNVTYLQPNAKQELMELMINTHDYFKDFQEHSNIYYRPDRWFPHVTIAKNNSLEELRNTVSFVMERFVPQIVQVERLVLVEMDYDGGEIYCRNRETKHLKKK